MTQNTPSQPQPDQMHPNRVLVVVLAPLFMALVAMSVINVALPAIGDSLHAGSGSRQWVISGYALTFALFLVPAGRAGDLTGRRRMLMAGVAAFTLGSVLAGLAWSPVSLNAARVLQGLGSGLLNPQSIGLIQQYFKGQARARAFAMFGTTVAVATAIGPLLGGVLIQVLGNDLGWRGIFLLNVPIGVATLVLARRWIPQDRPVREPGRRLDLDPVGTVLLAAGVLAIMIPFLERTVGSIIWIGLPIGLVLIGVWIWWEQRYKRRGRPPMVDPGIFTNVPFRNGILIVTLYFFGATSIWIIFPLYLQTHLHHSALAASIIGLPSSLAAAISSQVSGRYVLRLGRALVIAGALVAVLGMLGALVLIPLVEHGQTPFWIFAIPVTLIGISQGMTVSPNQTLTLQAVDSRFGGVAGGILSLGQRIGAAIGTALIPGILFGLVEGGQSWFEAMVVCIIVIGLFLLAASLVGVADRRREQQEATVAA